MVKKIALPLLIITIMLLSCQKNYRNTHVMGNLISIKSEGITTDFEIEKQKINNYRDLRLKTVIRNTGVSLIKINALFLNYPTLVLKVRKADGTQVFPGPPPVPPQDNGVTGRVQVAPGEYFELKLSGADYFGSDLPAGKYQVLFSYTAPENGFGDWQGTIQSTWIDFEIIGKN